MTVIINQNISIKSNLWLKSKNKNDKRKMFIKNTIHILYGTGRLLYPYFLGLSSIEYFLNKKEIPFIKKKELTSETRNIDKKL